MTPHLYHTYAIIPHPTEPCVQALPSDAGWVLPSFVAADLYYNDTKTINARIGALIRADVLTLRSITRWREEIDGVIHRHLIDEMVIRDAAEPHDGTWVSRADLSLATTQLEQVVDGWFAERKRGTSSTPMDRLRALWSYPGWFERAVEWIDMQLANQRIQRSAPVEQFRIWSLTAVLRAPTASGDLYFKAVPPIFKREPALTEALVRQYPQHLPVLLAVDAAQGWLLMRDFQAQKLADIADYAMWEAAIRRYAQLQIDQIGQTDALLALGCGDRRLNVLDNQIEPLLDSLPELSAGHFTDDEMSQFRAVIPQLRAMIRELAAGPIPPSLVHGDFHANNLAVKHKTNKTSDGDRLLHQMLYFDWTDGCIAHPFFDLIVFLHDSDYGSFGCPGDAKVQLQTAYLEPWAEFISPFAPPEILRSLLTLAYPLGLLHQAISYQGILEGIEPAMRWQFDFAPPDYLRSMLRSMPDNG